VDPEHIAEVKRIIGIKPEASPYARLAEEKVYQLISLLLMLTIVIMIT
jgi:hypothetical protein